MYLTDEQIEKAKQELALIYALPYASDLFGTAWEQILADLKGGKQAMARDNRARPDIIVPSAQGAINYSVKTEGLSPTRERLHVQQFLGYREDFIVARPKVDDLLLPGTAIKDANVDELGAAVLRFYNEQIVRKHSWHVIAFLLRLQPDEQTREFIYWEERPLLVYAPEDYWWADTERATGTNRNIAGYPRTVTPEQVREQGIRPTFRWTSGGKQFYILYDIPLNADTWTIDVHKLELEEVREALRELLRRKQQLAGHDSAT